MGLPPLTTQETWDLAKFFVVVWFLANWTVNAALRYTSVASATILASTSGQWPLLRLREYAIQGLNGVFFASHVGFYSDSSQPLLDFA